MGNKLKNKAPETQQVEKRKRIFVGPIMDLVSGNFLAEGNLVKHLPYLLFMVGIGLVYIANGYLAEDSVRQINKASSELKEMRSEFITTKSELMYTTKQSELARIIEERGLGLEESYSPPKTIRVSEEEWEQINDAN